MYIYLNIRKNKGQVLIILLGIIILLGTIIIGLSYRASHETKMVSATWERSKAFFTTWSGMRKVMEVLNQDDPTVDSWRDSWSTGIKKGKTEQGKWQVATIYDEERFVNINKVPRIVLKRIFHHVDPVLYYSLLDWLDSDHRPSKNPNTGKVLGAEDNYYRNNFGYECRDAALRNLFELRMIKKNAKLFNRSTSGSAPALNIDISSSENEVSDVDHILSLLGIRSETAYASGPPAEEPGTPERPPPPHPPPEPPEEWPPFDPGPKPAPVGPGRCITVYGNGKLNINTAYPGALLAMGLKLEALKRIYWYKLQGNVFQQASAPYIIHELERTNWLFPTEKKYEMIVNNIKRIAPRLKSNSSYFFVYLVSNTKEATHLAMAVIKRELAESGNTRCRIVSWWEWQG